MRYGAQNYNNMKYKNTMNVASVNTASRQTQYKPSLDYDSKVYELWPWHLHYGVKNGFARGMKNRMYETI